MTEPDRTLPNPERGCGTLERGKAYIRGTIASPDGVLPSFVRCDPFVPYREMGTDGGFTRGFLQFDGATAQHALDDITDFTRLYPGDADEEQAVTNMVDRGLYPNRDAVPSFEGQRHMDRVRQQGTMGASHFGAIDACRQSDLLMRAGKTHYAEPADYIEETVDMGLSKAIPMSKRQEPPVIQPGVTRCWIVHPETVDGWAVLGYAYLDEVVYTYPEDGNVPEYVREYAAAGRLDVVDIEDPPDAVDDPNRNLGDFEDDQAPPEPDADSADDADSDGTDGSDADAVPSTTVPDDTDSDQDVRPADPERDVVVLQREGHMDHLHPVGDGDTTLCGRTPPDDADATTVRADPGAIAKHHDICGTCLSALKAQVDTEEDDG